MGFVRRNQLLGILLLVNLSHHTTPQDSAQSSIPAWEPTTNTSDQVCALRKQTLTNRTGTTLGS